MSTLLPALGLGLVVGLQHALEPDHLAAVSTLLPEESGPRGAAARGGWWGLGHGAAIAGVGIPVVLLGASIPAPLEAAAELVVALMLIALGIRALRNARRLDAPATPARQQFGALPIGLIHGLAGTGAAVVLATAQAGTVAGALSFLLLFVIGSTLSMAAAAAAVTAPLGRLRSSSDGVARLMLVSGTFSLVVGLLWGGGILRSHLG